MIAAVSLGGCHRLMDCFEPTPLHRIAAAEHHRTVAPRKSVVRRVAGTRTVAAGARIRQFCGQRHVHFQTGRLRKSTQEKARNDVLCSQS